MHNDDDDDDERRWESVHLELTYSHVNLIILGTLRSTRCRFFIIMFGNVYITNFHKYLFHADMSKARAVSKQEETEKCI